jgi:ABC-type transport system involved in cytochrome c biogenesis ATPase subunit
VKNLIIVGGTAGVGKTTTCRELQRILPKNVFLDGDWCWDMRPFVVTEETKAMVESNIAHLLNGFLACSEFENVIFRQQTRRGASQSAWQALATALRRSSRSGWRMAAGPKWR